jgi:hypothetical protein
VRLERHFGVRLLCRGARGVSPTAAGRQIIPRVAKAVAELSATALVRPPRRDPRARADARRAVVPRVPRPSRRRGGASRRTRPGSRVGSRAPPGVRCREPVRCSARSRRHRQSTRSVDGGHRGVLPQRPFRAARICKAARAASALARSRAGSAFRRPGPGRGREAGGHRGRLPFALGGALHRARGADNRRRPRIRVGHGPRRTWSGAGRLSLSAQRPFWSSCPSSAGTCGIRFRSFAMAIACSRACVTRSFAGRARPSEAKRRRCS